MEDEDGGEEDEGDEGDERGNEDVELLLGGEEDLLLNFVEAVDEVGGYHDIEVLLGVSNGYGVLL